MTDIARPPRVVNGVTYRQLYYNRPCNKSKPYTDCSMGESDYLATDVWRELRNKRMALDHWTCQNCGHSSRNLVVHHINYPDVWGMEDVENDLVSVCPGCHAEIHKNDIAKGD